MQFCSLQFYWQTSVMSCCTLCFRRHSIFSNKSFFSWSKLTFCSFLSSGVFFNFLQNIFTYIAVRLDTIKLDIGQFQVGRVQISQHGQWGGVCGTGWDDRDARVTCRELGYPYAKVRKTLSSFLLPATKLRQGYVFTGVCDSVHRGGHAWQRGVWWQGACVAGVRAWQERRPLQRTIRILLECILFLFKWIERNNSSFSFFTFQMLHSAKL